MIQTAISKYPLTILVDVDNVLEDLVAAWVEALNKKYDRNVSPNDIIEWDITKFFPDLSRNQIFSPLHTKELWESLTPIPGAEEYLEKLVHDGHKVILLTSAHPDTVSYKYKFINKYFPYISFNDIIFASRKQMVKGDILIDDAPHNLIGGDYIKILMTAPHNTSFSAYNHNIMRVNTWEEIYELIGYISERFDRYEKYLK